MKTARGWLNQIGGPNALTVWSWILTLPLALVVSNIPEASPISWDIAQWTVVLLLVHVLLGGVMWLMVITLLPNRPRASRPVVALLCFVFLGIARAGLLEILDPLFGPQGTTLDSRLLTNVVGGTLVLALIAVVVDDYRTHVQILEQLRRAEASLNWLGERESDTLRAADLDEIANVRQLVEAQLQSGDTGPEHIRSISESIVRARSHYLTSTQEIDLLPEVRDRRSGWERVSRVLGGLNWPNPWVVALLVELVALSPAGATYGWPLAITNAVIGGLGVVATVWIARRFVPLPDTPVLRATLVLLWLVGVGLFVAWLTSVLVTVLISPFPVLSATGVVLIVTFGLGTSVWNSVTRNREVQRAVMLAAVSSEAEAVSRIHSEVVRRRSAASEFLHGPIQSQLVASALKGESNAEALEAIKQRFSEYSAASTTNRDARAQVSALVDAWSKVLDIKVDCTDDVWARLQREALTSRLLVDTLSEAVTNSIRHGTVADIEVTIDATNADDDQRVCVRVTSYGTLTRGIGNGTGLARLIDRGAHIALHQADGRVILTALL